MAGLLALAGSPGVDHFRDRMDHDDVHLLDARGRLRGHDQQRIGDPDQVAAVAPGARPAGSVAAGPTRFPMLMSPVLMKPRKKLLK